MIDVPKYNIGDILYNKYRKKYCIIEDIERNDYVIRYPNAASYSFSTISWIDYDNNYVLEKNSKIAKLLYF